jgi:uncharacterized membrane protein
MTAAPSVSPVPRRVYIDWLRGLAVLFMVLWHVVDSWHVPDGRDTRSFATVVFFAGWAAPMFLFLAGVSLPMAAIARMAKGVDRAAAVRAVMTRGWQVFLLAHLFRFQSFLLSPNAAWNGILKPDILNILGLGMVMAAFAWGRAETPRGRLGWLLLPALVVAMVLTPWARDWWWPSLLHPRLEGYIRVVSGNAVFSLFPAVAYVFAGTFVGSLLVESTSRTEGRFLTRAAFVGLGLLGLAIGSMFVPVSPGVQRWTGPGLIVALRIGAMLLALAGMRALIARRSPGRSDPMLALGRASLIVYWVHVELAYGNISYPLHKALSLGWALGGYALVTIAMYGLSIWWIRRPKGRPLVPVHMAAPVGLSSRVRMSRPGRQRW